MWLTVPFKELYSYSRFLFSVQAFAAAVLAVILTVSGGLWVSGIIAGATLLGLIKFQKHIFEPIRVTLWVIFGLFCLITILTQNSLTKNNVNPFSEVLNQEQTFTGIVSSFPKIKKNLIHAEPEPLSVYFFFIIFIGYIFRLANGFHSREIETKGCAATNLTNHF